MIYGFMCCEWVNEWMNEENSFNFDNDHKDDDDYDDDVVKRKKKKKIKNHPAYEMGVYGSQFPVQNDTHTHTHIKLME